MKRLAILRHARASSAAPGMGDLDRPLNEAGRMEARLVGRELDRRRVRFDLVLASPAVRVRETVAGLRQGSGSDCDLRFEPRIYEASAGRLLELVRELPDPAASVLLVGHNPGLQELLLDLTDRDGRGLRDRVREAYPTAALALVELATGRWPEVRPGGARIAELILPNELTG